MGVRISNSKIMEISMGLEISMGVLISPQTGGALRPNTTQLNQTHPLFPLRYVVIE